MTDLLDRKPLPQEGPAEGNLTLLVLVHSAAGDARRVVRPTLLAALEHFGLPYQIRDLRDADLTPEEACQHPAVLLAQEGLPVSAATAAALAQAHQAGVGVVSFAPLSTDSPDALAQLMGFRASGFASRTVAFQAADTAHWIMACKRPGQTFRLNRSVPVMHGTVSPDRRVLLVAGGGRPAVVAGDDGAGRTLQMLYSPRVYAREVLGHGECLDFLFWRGIVWAARKPLVAKRLPPLATAYVEAAIGDGPGGLLPMAPVPPYGGDVTQRQRFAWVEILNEFQWIPHAGVLTDCIPDATGRYMRALSVQGCAEFSAAGFTASLPIYFAENDEPLPENELTDHLRRVCLQFTRWGVTPASLVRPLKGQWSTALLTAQRPWPLDMLLTPFLPDEPAVGVHRLWSARPYGHLGYFVDTLPQDERVWLVGAIPAGPCAYERRPDGTYGITEAMAWHDFAHGCTVASGGRANDLDALAYRAAAAIIHGIEAGFPGNVMTRECCLAVLTKDELRTVLHQVNRLLIGHEVMHTRLSEAMRQLRDKVTCRLTRARLLPDSLALELTGHTTGPIQVAVLDNDGPAVRTKWVTVDAFHGTTHVRV